MADLYTRIQGDPSFIIDKIEIVTELEYLLIQIETILFTNKTEVLGSHLFGADLERMIFETNLSGSIIENIVNEQIRTYCDLASKYNTDVNCIFLKGTERDIALLDIVVDGRSVIGLTFT